AHIGDQRLVIELHRFLQHGASDLDGIVESELADDVDGRLVELRQPDRQPGANLGLDLVRQALDDPAESLDLLLAVTARDEEIGCVPKRACPALRCSARDGLVELPQISSCHSHAKPSDVMRAPRARSLVPKIGGGCDYSVKSADKFVIKDSLK